MNDRAELQSELWSKLHAYAENLNAAVLVLREAKTFADWDDAAQAIGNILEWASDKMDVLEPEELGFVDNHRKCMSTAQVLDKGKKIIAELNREMAKSLR